MNPAFFAVVPVMGTLSTIAHEMAHLWQQHFGDPGRRGYHNKEWGRKMKEIGLMPSNTGKPGGRQTGEQMTHYIIEGGRFEVSAKKLLAGEFGITWMDRYPDRTALIRLINSPDTEEAPDDFTSSPASIVSVDSLRAMDIPLEPAARENNTNRSKYTCTDCGINAWGTPGIRLACGDCDIPLVENAF